MYEAYISPIFCFSEPAGLSFASAHSSMIARKSFSACSASMTNAPKTGRSGGMTAVASQLPLTNRNRSSCGRTFLSMYFKSIPLTSGF